MLWKLVLGHSPEQSFHGPYYYSSDDFLLSLDLPKNLEYAVMINASDYLEEESNLSTLLEMLFQPCIDSPVDLVRIAVNFNNFQTCQNLSKLLKEFGYQIGLNLMQSQDKSYDEYASACNEISNWSSVDILYFADSLGSMNPDEVEFISNALKSNWSGPIGIHTHNNKGLAFLILLLVFIMVLLGATQQFLVWGAVLVMFPRSHYCLI